MSLALKTATPERQPRLLLVDDDPDLLRLLSMRLRASGYIVDAVESAESALATGWPCSTKYARRTPGCR